MKFTRFLLFLAFFVPTFTFGATSDFQSAAQLLAAARRGDIQTVQNLIRAGADVNYVDSTGLSLVCTAVMNNDKRTIQVLQMYGADASNCDRQIKQYKQKTKTAAQGEEYGFFSGLSSSHILALSAVGVVAVVGGLLLFTDVLDSSSNHNGGSSSGGSHGGGGGGGGSSASTFLTVPYGPAYLTPSGVVNPDIDVSANLNNWDTNSNSVLRVADFNYLRNTITVGDLMVSQAVLDGVNPLLENYLLDMHGYHSFANGYMGQNTFRDTANVPLLSETGYQKQPVRVALVTGNGINPAGSADLGEGIVYVTSTAANAETTRVDKYVNNILNKEVIGDDVFYSRTERTGFDLSGSGSVFNPFADVNDSALAKIVGGWEAGGRSTGDLYGFVPNGQLAIFRTGNGTVWNVIEDATSQTPVGSFTDSDPGEHAGLSAGDTIVLNGATYNIFTAVSQMNSDAIITIGGTSYKVSENSGMLIGVCDTSTGCSDNIAIYVGTDGAWYVNSTGGNDVDSVYIADSGNVYSFKTKDTNAAYTNFMAMQSALGVSDVVANTNVIPNSRQYSYLSVDNFTKAAELAGAGNDLKGFYSTQITDNYGTYTYTLNGQTISEAQGGVAHSMFNSYSGSKPMLIMPAGDYLFKDAATGTTIYDTLSATFENYAPMLYGSNLNHNFMTIIGVLHKNGTSSSTTISGYGDGISSSNGKFQLAMWVDSNSDIYSSRKCGIAGSGASASGIDPWCFAASGPTSEMATASAAGAVASVKSAFSYMTNDQIFTLLALTADGPYLSATTDGTVMNTDTLVTYLQSLYELPLEYNTTTMTSTEYLDAFKDVFGFGLINLERAVKPGYSIYYYADGNIVAADGKNNKFWGKTSTSSARSSTVLSLTGRGAIKTSFYDILESADGSLSLPRVWNTSFAMDTSSRHGLYMGDLLGEFDVGTSHKQSRKIGNFEFDMAVSPREYNDNYNGLDDLRVAFVTDDFEVSGGYQRHFTDGESRFDGRANGVLALASNVVSTGASYKFGNFAFGGRAFSGAITDESLLEYDPVVSSMFEPGRLGLMNGGAFDAKYNRGKFAMDLSFGVMHETDTVLGMYSDGLLTLRGGNTQYVDAVATYRPFENVKLSLRGTFANTTVDEFGGLISDVSDIKSNAFGFGMDIGGFGLSIAAPLAVTNGRVGYGYADFDVVENDGHYEIAMNNPHTEYIDLSAQNRELRFTTSYKRSLGAMTDGGVEFMYRVHPNNTSMFGNESVLMFKLHHRVGI